MRKNDEISDLNSCLNKAHPDEWLFVLLERDPAASEAIRAWIVRRIKLGKNKPGDKQIRDAEKIAAIMDGEIDLDRPEPPLPKMVQ